MRRALERRAVTGDGRARGRGFARARGHARGLANPRASRRDELLALQRAFSFDDAAVGVRVRRVASSEVRACVDMIADAFAETEDAKPRAYVLKYVIGLAAGEDAEEVGLVARELASDGSCGDVIGFVTVSVSSRTRPVEGTREMAAPHDAAYLGNACVRADRRRRGVGKVLVRAVEALVLEMGGCDVWLHVRAGEAPAMGLYAEAGYAETARERSFALAGLFGGRAPSPRVLMRKELRADGSCNFML